MRCLGKLGVYNSRATDFGSASARKCTHALSRKSTVWWSTVWGSTILGQRILGLEVHIPIL